LTLYRAAVLKPWSLPLSHPFPMMVLGETDPVRKIGRPSLRLPATG
jgi:hypothetical protein